MSLEELFVGKTVTTLIDYDQICPQCKGIGHPVNVKAQPCPKCQQGPIKIHSINCELCEGSGQWIHQTHKCKKCNGIKIVKDRKKLLVQIPAGAMQNDRMQLHNKGNQYPGKKDGHIYISIKEKRHPFFIRRGNDLYLTRTIQLADALSGYPMQLITLDGKTLSLQTGSPVLDNSIRRVPGQGMPVRQNPKRRGNLMIQFRVVFPKRICKPEDKEQLGKILGQASTPLLTSPLII